MIKMSENICRICLQHISFNNFISLNYGQPSVGTKLNSIAPELDLDIIWDPVVCEPCSVELEQAYQFKLRCLKAEECIQRYVNNSTSSSQDHLNISNIVKYNESLSQYEEIRFEQSAKFHQNIDSKRHLTRPLSVTQNPLNGGLHLCRTCKETFITREELAQHIPNHFASRPFMCNVCKKCFTLRTNLQVHMRTHTHSRPFPCDLCPKSFTTKGNLLTHVRVHTKEKPYSCVACDKRFTQKVQLNIHLMSHQQHPQTPSTSPSHAHNSLAIQKTPATPSSSPLQIGSPIFSTATPSIFPSTEKFDHHITVESKPVVCVECGDHFPHQVNFSEHYHREHGSCTTENGKRSDITLQQNQQRDTSLRRESSDEANISSSGGGMNSNHEREDDGLMINQQQQLHHHSKWSFH